MASDAAGTDTHAAPLLEARDIHFDYDGVQALAGCDVGVRAGENLAVLGHNGSGKSTLFMHLNGTLKPKGGEVRLDGAPIGYDRKSLAELRRRVGLVLQNPDDQLFAATVRQDVSYGPKNLGLPDDEVRAATEAAMRELDVLDLADRATHRLSFGQKKRVVLAGVIAMSPRVLLLDEPAAGLDTRGADELFASLQRLKERGVTSVMATHDVDFAWQWADAAVVMRAGRIVANGRMEEIFPEGVADPGLDLHSPLLLEIGRMLAGRGIVPRADATPRTMEELRRAVRNGGGASHPTKSAQTSPG